MFSTFHLIMAHSLLHFLSSRAIFVRHTHIMPTEWYDTTQTSPSSYENNLKRSTQPTYRIFKLCFIFLLPLLRKFSCLSHCMHTMSSCRRYPISLNTLCSSRTYEVKQRQRERCGQCIYKSMCLDKQVSRLVRQIPEAQSHTTYKKKQKASYLKPVLCSEPPPSCSFNI